MKAESLKQFQFGSKSIQVIQFFLHALNIIECVDLENRYLNMINILKDEIETGKRELRGYWDDELQKESLEEI